MSADEQFLVCSLKLFVQVHFQLDSELLRAALYSAGPQHTGVELQLQCPTVTGSRSP